MQKKRRKKEVGGGDSRNDDEKEGEAGRENKKRDIRQQKLNLSL